MAKASWRGMKKRRTNFDTLAEKFNTRKSYKDERFYYPERDDEGNGYAVLRFLPTGVDTTPFAMWHEHWFQGPAGWFKHNCRNDLTDDQCPVCDVNRDLVKQFGDWDSVPEAEKKIVRNRKRNLRFVANVYVVKDTKNPENEGKVMLFMFGSKIMEMIKSAIKPEFEDEQPFNPFDPWEGANFAFKIRKVKNQTNYDKSGWETASPLFEDDDEIDALVPKVNDLTEFSEENEKFYSSYTTQLNDLNRVLGETKKQDEALPCASQESEAPSAETESSAQSSESVMDSDDDPENLKSVFADDGEDDDIPW